MKFTIKILKCLTGSQSLCNKFNATTLTESQALSIFFAKSIGTFDCSPVFDSFLNAIKEV